MSVEVRSERLCFHFRRLWFRIEDSQRPTCTPHPDAPIVLRSRSASFPLQEGFGRFAMNVQNGWRHHTATAYLRPAKSRPNLKVCAPTSNHAPSASHLSFPGSMYLPFRPLLP